MNDFLSKERLDQLINATGDYLVSLFMPTHPLPVEAQQDPMYCGYLCSPGVHRHYTVIPFRR
ncbi:MAG TPA: hypothetical protein PKE45_04575 [Caldilineaceae bacterium]|nr:hypothetical protein [Caldilineaceae bacterium]